VVAEVELLITLEVVVLEVIELLVMDRLRYKHQLFVCR
jgi:hypothetical protein